MRFFPNYKKVSSDLAGHFHSNVNKLRNIEHNKDLKNKYFYYNSTLQR